MPKTLSPPNIIGANIRAAREAHKPPMTQLALGHALGWTGPDAGAQISRFESGLKEPRISTLTKIAGALGIHVSHLLRVRQIKP